MAIQSPDSLLFCNWSIYWNRRIGLTDLTDRTDQNPDTSFIKRGKQIWGFERLGFWEIERESWKGNYWGWCIDLPEANVELKCTKRLLPSNRIGRVSSFVRKVITRELLKARWILLSAPCFLSTQKHKLEYWAYKAHAVRDNKRFYPLDTQNQKINLCEL